MSERKLYFPGLGGNRYEISLEELQKQAYKGKIKRDDKIIVVKTKHGQTTEIETTCGKIRVAAEAFDQGEADRKAEAERKLADKQAKEAARAAKKKEREAAAKEAAQKSVSFVRRQIQSLQDADDEKQSTSQDSLFQSARRAVKKFIVLVMTVVIVISTCACLFRAYLAFNPAYESAYENAYDKTYDKTFHELFDEKSKEIYNIIYNQVFDGEVKKREEEEQRKNENDKEAEDYKEIDKESAEKAFLLSAETFAKTAADDTVETEVRRPANEAAERAGKQAAFSAGLAAGSAASFIALFCCGVPAGILIFVLYLLMRYFFDIVLTIARYRTETLERTALNVANNANYSGAVSNPLNPIDAASSQGTETSVGNS